MIYVWGIARTIDAQIILRIEDHDLQRCKPEYEAAILDDLEWLGFLPDEPSIQTFRNGQTPFRQSDNTERYENLAEELHQQGLVYGCDYSRKQLEAQFDLTHGDPPAGAQLPYPNLSRGRGLGLGGDVNVRLKLPDARVTFHDLRLGRIEQYPQAQCGDVKIRDRRGNWNYQFACTVDDLDQGIDLIIRGEDLLESTGRQILLRDVLGEPQRPHYLHHSLLTSDSGRKLSKRQFDTSISELRENGTPAEALIGEAALLGGFTEKSAVYWRRRSAGLFSTLNKFQKTLALFSGFCSQWVLGVSTCCPRIY